MSTGFILNSFAHYEDRGGEKGITLTYAGVPFWFPYKRVTAIPNWALREVDHDKSTPQAGENGELVYRTDIVNGQRIVEELCDKQIPIPMKDMGIRGIAGKLTGNVIRVPAGCSADGAALFEEIPEREPTKTEKEEAEMAADTYRKAVIADYFQSKRERMTGGRGKIHPDVTVRGYMEEMNVEDIDDVSAHARHDRVGGVDPDVIAAIIREAMKGTAELNAETIRKTVETIRKSGNKPQISPYARQGNRDQGLAEHAAEYDRKQAELAAQEQVVGAQK